MAARSGKNYFDKSISVNLFRHVVTSSISVGLRNMPVDMPTMNLHTRSM